MYVILLLRVHDAVGYQVSAFSAAKRLTLHAVKMRQNTPLAH